MTGPSLLSQSNLVTENAARKQGLKVQNTKIMPKIAEDTEITTVVRLSSPETLETSCEIMWNPRALHVTLISATAKAR